MDQHIVAVYVQAASYLGHKKVEQLATNWLCGVVLFMINGDELIKGLHANQKEKGVVGLLKKAEQGWQQVLSQLNHSLLFRTEQETKERLSGDYGIL